MTVTEKASRRVISGFGWTNPLTHTFELENSTHLKVYADDVELVLGVDYSITGVGVDSGYSVTISTPGAWTPDVWVLDVSPPISQADDISLGGAFGARFEEGLDALTRRVQRIRDDARRAFKVPRTTAVGEAPVVNPIATGNFWKSDGSGNMVDGGSAEDIINAQGYAAAAAASAVAAAVAEDGAEAALADLLERYLGAFASDGAATAAAGGAPITGAEYFNTTTNTMRVYTGAVWQDTPAPPDGSVTTIKLADDAVTADKMADRVYRSRPLGRYGVLYEGVGVSAGNRTINTATFNAAAASGVPVSLPDGDYEINGQLTFATAKTVWLGTRRCVIRDTRAAAAASTISIAADDIELRGFAIDGGLSTYTYVDGHRGIYCNRTVYTPSHVINYTYRANLIDLSIKNYGGDGIRADYVQKWKVRGCHVERTGAHGIMFGAGCFDNDIDDNYVGYVYPGNGGGVAPYHPAYGISLTRDPSRNTTDAPISKRNRVRGNLVEYVPTWIGIDSHGSQDTLFEGNTVRFCSIGIHLEDGDATGLSVYVPSSFISIIGNTIIGLVGVTFDSIVFKAGPGINVAGAGTDGSPQISILVANNAVTNCGADDGLYVAGTRGAIHAVGARGLTINGNSITTPRGMGISLDDITGAIVLGNQVYNLAASGGIQTNIAVMDGDVTFAADLNTFFGSSPGLGFNAISTVDAGYEYKLGTNNQKYGTMTLLGSNLPTPG